MLCKVAFLHKVDARHWILRSISNVSALIQPITPYFGLDSFHFSDHSCFASEKLFLFNHIGDNCTTCPMFLLVLLGQNRVLSLMPLAVTAVRVAKALLSINVSIKYDIN